ncbi:choline transporter-like protein 4 isoform X4 [Eriocheir sinensis]|uniref:choline transporter-like protein 4 isoform X4 n=1 Tax=Eriocheir sinensis TaxID=95602 RepID=UPI0021C939A5|nr:choline transporter-like protein 4 isoform X4 [Eriocheir sinensis]XP_050713801.1 choline transporter-like protein 4 isoform X4 [Eriocheir sinensis]XP_050713802.1 choline transporter-like protein 4 isoform X4 [Eriocheir sinensis]XP_050713803.1 choline transporter-like protein 4 isoform X4 [Eriocheir sinensis]XP_050713804.1 choline transporter-like protein 4 isoform X4 [Eriocheir sinensis]XP_050713805.1 choline transporter-like protein 4 isoform X4 [Eriocheir sinensis]
MDGEDHDKQYGEALQHDPEFSGPLKNRSCTDIICLLLFIAFLVGWGVVAGFAVYGGDPERLLHPTDSEGRVCGRGEFVNQTFLFFFDLTRCASPKVIATGCPTPQVCVSECPAENWFYTGTGDDTAERSKLICRSNVNPLDTSKTIRSLVENNDCAFYYVESKSFGHRCIPKDINANVDTIIKAITASHSLSSTSGSNTLEVLNKMVDAMKYVVRFARLQQVAEGVFMDIRTGWWVLLSGFVLAMVVSFLWIVLLRFISTFMIWFSIFAFLILSGFGAYYTLNKYLTLRESSNATMSEMSEMEMAFSLEFNHLAELETTWLVFFIITVTVFVICLFIFIFLRKRISIAIALIGEASKAVGSIMSTLFFPVVPYILQLIFLFFFCVVAVLLASAGTTNYRIMCTGTSGCGTCTDYKENDTCSMDTFNPALCPDATCQFYDYVVDPKVPYFHVYNVFGLFWSMFFISAFGEMVLAGAFASWYWVHDKSRVPTFAVTNSVGRTLRYHTGTLAFGSLIIAIVRMIRVILEYIDRKVREKTDSKIVRALLCCCRCCLYCLEKFLKFINRNAYVYCAIYGKNFCVSAKNAFSLIMRNIVRVVVLDQVTDFLLFIGKMVVVGSFGVASFFIFSGEVPGVGPHLPEMNYYLTPVIIITIATFFIASAFFDVYAMAVDTLFLCFLEDCERNDGSEERKYFMSKNLMNILGKKNKDKDKEE